jgi:hypothetical protein
VLSCQFLVVILIISGNLKGEKGYPMTVLVVIS